MRLSRPAAALLALALTVFASPRVARAQGQRPFDIGVSGGPAFLSGEDREFYKLGYNGQLSALVPIRAAGITLRADLTYLGVPGRNRSTQTVVGAPDTLLVGDLSLFGGTLGAVVWGGPPSRSIRPYFNVGAGVYRIESEGVLYGQRVSGADTKFGVLGGAGITFPVGRSRAFVEGRVHNVFAEGGSARIFPISVGLLF